MIDHIRIQNFKSWKDTGELQLAPLTGLFGTNSSGKTSILQMLLMLKQTTELPDRKRVLHTGDSRSLVDVGTFSDLIHGHQSDRSLEFMIRWGLPQPLVIRDPERLRELFKVQSLCFETSISSRSGIATVDAFRYTFEKEKFGMSRREGDKKADKDRYNLESGGYAAKRVQGRAWSLPPPVKCYGFPDEAVGYYQNLGFLPDFVLSFEGLFSQVFHLGPLREYPQRSYVWAGVTPVDVGRRGEQAIPALLASRSMGKTVSQGQGRRPRLTVEERIASWFRKMKMIHSFELQPLAENRKEYEVRVKKSQHSEEVLITDVGFGVSQLLPVLVLCYYVPEGATLLLEQPEIHLHPSVQADLADVLVDVVKRRKIQIIVESHSEHLLRRIQRRIAEDLIPSDMTALYFCRMDNSSSRIEKLNIDLFGSITNWPEDFWGDEMGELVAMTEAARRRQGSSPK